ncbi:hypothetical protein M427DRAFT_58788 [Gonapodya prolifera JEL478]|uniref:Uncharacterized protein n=1 Tax=Gonapodya prolifera (strain JEL478) TaxID=1344416 RepID=A0A139A999_GONPJ|nr:hypothetical protein M427DRAFT_58788 [Gonapodya prolifera JEL478]|eukprot:KXS13238.1 hypothetical protein M427DRAFT_58788 [Gonapodya prolifera JEL478]
MVREGWNLRLWDAGSTEINGAGGGRGEVDLDGGHSEEGGLDPDGAVYLPFTSYDSVDCAFTFRPTTSPASPSPSTPSSPPTSTSTSLFALIDSYSFRSHRMFWRCDLVRLSPPLPGQLPGHRPRVVECIPCRRLSLHRPLTFHHPDHNHVDERTSGASSLSLLSRLGAPKRASKRPSTSTLWRLPDGSEWECGHVAAEDFVFGYGYSLEGGAAALSTTTNSDGSKLAREADSSPGLATPSDTPRSDDWPQASLPDKISRIPRARAAFSLSSKTTTPSSSLDLETDIATEADLPPSSTYVQPPSSTLHSPKDSLSLSLSSPPQRASFPYSSSPSLLPTSDLLTSPTRAQTPTLADLRSQLVPPPKASRVQVHALYVRATPSFLFEAATVGVGVSVSVHGKSESEAVDENGSEVKATTNTDEKTWSVHLAPTPLDLAPRDPSDALWDDQEQGSLSPLPRSSSHHAPPCPGGLLVPLSRSPLRSRVRSFAPTASSVVEVARLSKPASSATRRLTVHLEAALYRAGGRGKYHAVPLRVDLAVDGPGRGIAVVAGIGGGRLEWEAVAVEMDQDCEGRKMKARKGKGTATTTTPTLSVRVTCISLDPSHLLTTRLPAPSSPAPLPVPVFPRARLARLQAASLGTGLSSSHFSALLSDPAVQAHLLGLADPAPTRDISDPAVLAILPHVPAATRERLHVRAKVLRRRTKRLADAAVAACAGQGWVDEVARRGCERAAAWYWGAGWGFDLRREMGEWDAEEVGGRIAEVGWKKSWGESHRRQGDQDVGTEQALGGNAATIILDSAGHAVEYGGVPNGDGSPAQSCHLGRVHSVDEVPVRTGNAQKLHVGDATGRKRRREDDHVDDDGEEKENHHPRKERALDKLSNTEKGMPLVSKNIRVLF